MIHCFYGSDLPNGFSFDRMTDFRVVFRTRLVRDL